MRRKWETIATNTLARKHINNVRQEEPRRSFGLLCKKKFIARKEQKNADKNGKQIRDIFFSSPWNSTAIRISERELGERVKKKRQPT